MVRASRETRDKSQSEIKEAEEYQKWRRMQMNLISFHKPPSTIDSFFKARNFCE